MYGGGSSDEDEDEYSRSRGSSQTRDRSSLERDEKAQMTEERRAKLREIEVHIRIVLVRSTWSKNLIPVPEMRSPSFLMPLSKK